MALLLPFLPLAICKWLEAWQICCLPT